MQRNPSHFGSYDMPSAVGILATLFASIGSTGGAIGSFTWPSSHVPHRVTELKCEEFVGVAGNLAEDVVEAQEGVPFLTRQPLQHRLLQVRDAGALPHLVGE